MNWLDVWYFLIHCREAFSGFEAEVIAKFTEKKITSISSRYGIDISQVRGFVDNSHRILQVLINHKSLILLQSFH